MKSCLKESNFDPLPNAKRLKGTEKSEIIKTVIRMFTLWDQLWVIWGFISNSRQLTDGRSSDGHSELLSWRGVILSSADINYDHKRLELHNIWVKAGYIRPPGGKERSVMRGRVRQTKQTQGRIHPATLRITLPVTGRHWESRTVEHYFCPLYWWAHIPASHSWPVLLWLLGELVISQPRGLRSCRGQGEDRCPMLTCLKEQSAIPW